MNKEDALRSAPIGGRPILATLLTHNHVYAYKVLCGCPILAKLLTHNHVHAYKVVYTIVVLSYDYCDFSILHKFAKACCF